MGGIFMIAALLGTCGALLVPFLGIAVVLMAVAALALIGAAIQGFFEGVQEFLEHPVVKFILITAVIWIAIAGFKVPVKWVVLAAILCVVLLRLAPLFQAIEEFFNELFEHPFMKALVIIGLMIGAVIFFSHK